MATWKLEDAKNQFSKLVELARREGPQFVMGHGREEVVVMAAEDYRRLARKQKGLVAFMSASPLAEAFAAGELEIRHPCDLPRDIVL